MIHTLSARSPDRLDRHVRRIRFRAGPGVSRHRMACALEEALRLTELPGEREGRVYYFRKVSLGTLRDQAIQGLWMDSVQRVLSELAASALHGNDPRADAGNAVYFDNQEQAFEVLLRRALLPKGQAPWFLVSALGSAHRTDDANPVLCMVERLRQPDLPPRVSAGIILAALGDSAPEKLLAALPADQVRAWLREMDNRDGSLHEALPIRLPAHLKQRVERAARHFGWHEPRTVWLAALGLYDLAPSASGSNDVVRRARSTLRQMEQEQSAAPHRRASLERADIGRMIFDERGAANPERIGAVRKPAGPSAALSAASAASSAPSAEDQDGVQEAMTAAGSIVNPTLLGESTKAAGLYFLLNALRHLGIEDALQRCPALGAAHFVAHLLKRLADHAAVPRGDPILACLTPDAPDAPEISVAPAVLAELTEGDRAWPKNLALRPAISRGDDLLRVWLLAVRQWCWRNGRISVREIVLRSGRVWLTRTDLDVTLPLDEAEIRIRRIGLDIDPGWVPWFGEFGRVVRFHYRERR
jgi:hypothetical protein